ncbi:MAG TPA: VOC family protein [Thermoanaerobaculia bacterium]|nr:VOC family protein [Thermoanaerobaculia bacterium]
MTRRLRISVIAAAAAVFLFGAASASAAQAPIAKAIDSVGMTVADMDRAVAFYSGVLTFQKVSDVEVAGADYEHLEGVFGLRMRVVRMRLGSESIELTEYIAPRGRPIPPDLRSNDRSFQHVAIIVRDMDAAYARLRANRVEHASSGPQRLPDWNRNAAGIRAFYFRDPDGHPLEILQFPADKGDARWQVPGDALFLGIDHTAIVVSDTDASLKFYRDLLGLKVAGESENSGVEQEHLNNVFGARLRITSLKPASGPSIEFLEYLSPRDGRPAPETRANDVLHRQTRVTTSDASAAARRLTESRAELVSPGTVALEKRELGFRRGFLAKDPDGHVIEIVEE